MQFHRFLQAWKAFRGFGRVFVVVGLVTLVAACAQPPVSSPRSVYPTVKVRVMPPGTPCPPGWTCKPIPPTNDVMAVSEDPIRLRDFARPVTINWQIDQSPGWTFTTHPSGILVTPGNWNEQPVGSAGLDYSATGTTKDGLPYKYHISVSRGSAPPVKWDPIIFND